MEKKGFDKIIIRYSGTAAAVLGASSLHAQNIIWQDIQDTVLNKNGSYFDIDMDTNGVVDYRITQFIDSTKYDISGSVIDPKGTAGNEVMGIQYGNYNYPFRLNIGDSIKSGEAFKGAGAKGGYLAFRVGDTFYPNSDFVDTANGIQNGLIGVRFYADRDDTIRAFYGWILVDVAADLRSMTIKEFAYEDNYDNGIAAGHGSVIGADEKPVGDLPELAQRGLFLDIKLPESHQPEARLSIVSLNGQVIEEKQLNALSNSVPLENLPKGIHVAVVSANGHEVSRKIVVY